MQVANAPDSFRARADWTEVQVMKTLGQYVSNNGSVGECVSNACKQMWGAFYSNFCPGLLASSEKVKLSSIRCSLMSICSWRWARWPFCKTVAARLDSVQSHFMQILFPIVQSSSESADALFL